MDNLAKRLEKIPEGLLNGKFLHCQPVEDGVVAEAPIIRVKGLATTGRIIVCRFRKPTSQCKLLDGKCHYWRTDYIIGPGLDKKSY